jgi:hypothetical protein
VLIRRLIPSPEVSDLFGQAGRRWLGELELPLEERETLASSMRQIEFLDTEINEVERVIALDALRWPELRRLMSVPGVNVICAASFLAATGPIGRFKNPRKLVGYLGLDPKVRQSGPGARHERPDLQTGLLLGPLGAGRSILERGRAARSDARVLPAHPRPPRPPGRRRRRRAQARLPVLVPAHPGEDYAYQQPSLTKKKLRRLEIAAGAPKYPGRTSIWSTNLAMREAERALAEQAELAYRNTVRDWHATQTKRAKTTATAEVGASVTPGHASNKPKEGKAARQTTSP